MRPPEFTGGNLLLKVVWLRPFVRFNEAAGIHRRKLTLKRNIRTWSDDASMRPPEFTGGNMASDGKHPAVDSPLQ